MVNPYSTPLVPPVPHATPLTSNQNIRPPRPPIHNPYDKFTQPDFDAWIGDITSALRKALGHESEPRGGGRAESDATRSPEGDDGSMDEDDEAVDDSFADVKIRRAKGKGRDPREGPGLGGRLHPIEIRSDSESSDQEVDKGSEDGEEEYEWREDSEQDDAPAGFEASDDISDVVEIPKGRADSRGSSPSVVIELFSDDDDGDGKEEDGLHGQSEQRTEHIGECFDEDREQDQDRSEEGHNATVDANEKYRLGMAKFGFPEPDGHREGHTPDLHTGSPTMDPEVTDFPPFHGTQPLELPDPWIGPETYAEDFYSGGDLRADDLRSCSPSHPTPSRNGIGIGMALTLGTITPSEDTKNKREDDVLPSSSPLAPSPVERFEDLDARGHMSDDWYFQGTQNDAQSGISTVEANVQVDWNWPAAFSTGKTASESGRLATSLARGSRVKDELVNTVVDEGMDDDEFDELIYGAAPLGTSDLDVHKHENEGREDGDGDVDDELVDVEAKSSVDTPPQEFAQRQEKDVIVVQAESVMVHEPITSFDKEPMSPGPAYDMVDCVTSGTEPAEFGVWPTASFEDDGVEMFDKGQTSEEAVGYMVIEVEVEDETGLVNEDDVVSVSQGVFDEQNGENMAYIVEESVTEGRRTEEPEVREPTRQPSVDSSEAQSGSHVQVSENLSEEVPPLKEAEGHTESVPATLMTEDFLETPLMESGPLEGADRALDTRPITFTQGGVETYPDNAPLTSSNGSDTAVEVANVNMRDNEEIPNVDSTGTVDISANDGPHNKNVQVWGFKTGIPLPISADPNVPDCAAMPASPMPDNVEHIPNMPRTPAFVSTSVNAADELAPASDALPSSSLKAEQSLPSQGTNGLFTPADGTDSGYGTPNRAESEIGAIYSQEIAQIEEVPSAYQQMDITDESSNLDSRPESAERELETIPTDHPVALMSKPVEPSDFAEFAVPSNQVAGSMESSECRASVYLTIPHHTDPILCADPYPYSLSTPGSELHDSLRQAGLGQDLDVTSEDEHEHEHSSSSSDAGDKDVVPNNEINLAENMVLMYPSEREYSTESPTSVRQRTLPPESQESISGHEESGTVDVDADHVASHEPHPDEQHQLDSSFIVDDGDPFELTDDDKLAPFLAVEGAMSAGKDAIPLNGAKESEGSPFEETPVESHNTTTMPETFSPVVLATTEFATQQTDGRYGPGDDVQILSTVSESSSERPPKRKRKPHTPTTRSKSAALLSAQRIGKEKRVEKGVDSEDGEYDEDDAAAEIESTSSGASTASMMLRAASRASSTFSAAPSSSSSSGTQFSPAVNRKSNNPEVPPAPLFHTHGSAGHAHQSTNLHRAPLTHAVQQESQKTINRAKDVSKEPGPSQPASPQTRPSSSPLVTRSQCRFHKISLRAPTARRRIYFVVPGCSLGDRELMTKEGIQDHGSATIEDSKRMVADLQSQDIINLDVVGSLRKLVGVDLLREQEVFYLPPRARRPPAVSRPRLSAPDQALMPPKNTNIRSSPLSTLSPVSSISQASSEASPARPQHLVRPLRYLPVSERAMLSTRNNIDTASSPTSPLSPLSSAAYYSDNALNDGEGAPGLKRQRKASLDVTGDVQSGEMGPLTGPAAESATTARKSKRRNKRLSMDAAQYRPAPDDGAESEADGMAGKSPNRRAIKRARTSEAAGDTGGTETRKEKKRKLRLALTMDAEHDQSEI